MLRWVSGAAPGTGRRQRVAHAAAHEVEAEVLPGAGDREQDGVGRGGRRAGRSGRRSPTSRRWRGSSPSRRRPRTRRRAPAGGAPVTLHQAVCGPGAVGLAGGGPRSAAVRRLRERTSSAPLPAASSASWAAPVNARDPAAPWRPGRARPPRRRAARGRRTTRPPARGRRRSAAAGSAPAWPARIASRSIDRRRCRPGARCGARPRRAAGRRRARAPRGREAGLEVGEVARVDASGGTAAEVAGRQRPDAAERPRTARASVRNSSQAIWSSASPSGRPAAMAPASRDRRRRSPPRPACHPGGRRRARRARAPPGAPAPAWPEADLGDVRRVAERRPAQRSSRGSAAAARSRRRRARPARPRPGRACP